MSQRLLFLVTTCHTYHKSDQENKNAITRVEEEGTAEERLNVLDPLVPLSLSLQTGDELHLHGAPDAIYLSLVLGIQVMW